jgi:hypothetical protein
MSNLLSIQPGLPPRGSGDSAAPTRNLAPAPAPVPKPVPLFVNPSFQYDSTVGLVVIDFHDNTGRVTNSIPSQQQLDAYRSHRAFLPREGPPPTAQSPSSPITQSPPATDGKTAAG